jgi:hypothetical protein
LKLSVKLSDGSVRMGPGSLYTTIQRLVEAALIKETEPEQTEDSRRRLYKLTEVGRSLLAFEVDRMESVVKIARSLELGIMPRWLMNTIVAAICSWYSFLLVLYPRGLRDEFGQTWSRCCGSSFSMGSKRRACPALPGRPETHLLN